MTLVPIITRERAAKMTVSELIRACVEQVDAQDPTLDNDERQVKAVRLFAAVSSQVHRDELAANLIRESLGEVHESTVDMTAAALFSPEVDPDGSVVGYVSFRGDDGVEYLRALPAARREDFERPFHLHHREQYLAVAQLMRKHGMDNYQAAYEAGILTSRKDAS